jgi:hypothetical protein
MTESWEREFEVARIAHGDLNATIQTMLKEDYTIEEASYVLYDDADLIKAVLADPNWSDRILKQPAGHQILDNQMHFNTTGGQPQNIPAPNFQQQKTGLAALNPFINHPADHQRQQMTNWFGADRMKEMGIQPKEGFMGRLKSGQEMRNARRAAKRAQPGWFRTLINEGGEGLRRRRQQRDAIDMATDVRQLGYDPATQGRAGERAATLEEAGLPAPPPPAALPAPTEAPIEEAPESTSDFAERMTSEAEQPPADGVPVESPATEEEAGRVQHPFWAKKEGRGARKGNRFTPRIPRLGASTAAKLQHLTAPTEGQTAEDWLKGPMVAPEGGWGVNEEGKETPLTGMTSRQQKDFLAAMRNPELRPQLIEMMGAGNIAGGHQFPFMADDWQYTEPDPQQAEEEPMSVAEANETLTPQEDPFNIDDLLADDANVTAGRNLFGLPPEEASTADDDLSQQVKNLIPEDTSTDLPSMADLDDAVEPKPDLTGKPVKEKKQGLLERGKAKLAEKEAENKPSAGEFDLDLDPPTTPEQLFGLPKKTSSDSMDMAWDHLTMLKRYE